MDTHDKTGATRGGEKSGFTLIELMVVLVIMSILGSQTVPTIADAWDKYMLRRIAAKVLVMVSVARQHAIADERATLIQFSHDAWCMQYQDQQDNTCSLGLGKLPSRYKFSLSQSYQFTLFYSAGRGFSPLSAGAAKLYSERSKRAVQIINSSIGRVRLCSPVSIPGIAPC